MAYQSPDNYRGVIKKAKKLIYEAKIQMGHPDKNGNYMPVTFRNLLLKSHDECCTCRSELENLSKSLKAGSPKIEEYKQCLREMKDCVSELEEYCLSK